MDPIFAEIGKASEFGSGSYFEAGEYELTLLEYFMNQGHKGLSAIAVFHVDASAKSESDKEPAPVGSQRSAVFKFSGENGKIGMGKAKTFSISLFKPRTEQVSDSDASSLMSRVLGDARRNDGKKSGAESQPMRGRKIKLSATTATKKTRNGIFITNLNWGFMPQTGEELKARRAELDKQGM